MSSINMGSTTHLWNWLQRTVKGLCKIKGQESEFPEQSRREEVIRKQMGEAKLEKSRNWPKSCVE